MGNRGAEVNYVVHQIEGLHARKYDLIRSSLFGTSIKMFQKNIYICLLTSPIKMTFGYKSRIYPIIIKGDSIIKQRFIIYQCHLTKDYYRKENNIATLLTLFSKIQTNSSIL